MTSIFPVSLRQTPKNKKETGNTILKSTGRSNSKASKSITYEYVIIILIL